jgi:hypothetical protein
MFGLFKKNPVRKIQKKIDKKYQESVVLQRNGKLREYGMIIQAIDVLEKEIEQIQNDQK